MDPNAETLFFVAAVSILLSGAIAAYCFVLMRSQRAALRECLEKNAEMEKTLSTCREQLRAISLKSEDLTRLTAWLETRVRDRKAGTEKTNSETSFTAKADLLRSSITERRHRVLKLAARGQNPESIAAALGMFNGEVELILNLNRAI